MPVAALDNWQPVWNAQVSISTPVCVNFELRPGAGDIHICWFNFGALAQGNAYKPTKEPINYRGPGGDRPHDLQTEATPPAASCPARTLHATEIASKNATPMTCPWLHWTTVNPSGMHRCQFPHLCVLILNCTLALAIYIFVDTYIHTYLYIYYPLYNNQPITRPDSHHVIRQYNLYFLHEKLYWTVLGKPSNIGYIGQFWNEAARTQPTRPADRPFANV